MSKEWNTFRYPSQPPNCLGLVLNELGMAKDGSYNTRALEHDERCEIVFDPNKANAAAYVVFPPGSRDRVLNYASRIQHVVRFDPLHPNDIKNRLFPGAEITPATSLEDAFSDAREFDPGGEIVYLRLK